MWVTIIHWKTVMEYKCYDLDYLGLTTFLWLTWQLYFSVNKLLQNLHFIDFLSFSDGISCFFICFLIFPFWLKDLEHYSFNLTCFTVDNYSSCFPCACWDELQSFGAYWRLFLSDVLSTWRQYWSLRPHHWP